MAHRSVEFIHDKHPYIEARKAAGPPSAAVEGELIRLRSGQELRELLNREMRGVWSQRSLRHRRRRRRRAKVEAPTPPQAPVDREAEESP